MKSNTNRPKASNLVAITKKADPKILQLFPSLNFLNTTNVNDSKTSSRRRLACLKAIGKQGHAQLADLLKETGITRPELNRTLKELIALSLVQVEKKGKKTVYKATTAGYVALTAFAEFRTWVNIKATLAVPEKKNDPLAYALLVVGFSSNKPETVYEALCRYAAQGAGIENTVPTMAAEAFLFSYRQQLRVASSVPSYLSVFKEFTTTGFQEFFQMLLIAVKPTAEDYNWLIEFFNEISEFYFDPARIAFINLLPENEKLRQKLEKFKKTQDQQIKKQDGNLEVTFTIPGSGLSKIDSMPPHLRAIGMRLILEPMKFINSELVEFFWNK
jgi:predicted transcriptional regulator